MIRRIRYFIIFLFLSSMVYLIYDAYNDYIIRQKLITTQKKELAAKTEVPKPILTLPPDPVGSGPIPMPPPPQKDGQEQHQAPVAKVEVVGVVKFEISEDNSWQTVYKILAIILGSVLGIRIINTGFNKIERQT